MNPLELIQRNFDNFTKTEEVIAAYILNNPKDFARASIEISVEQTQTSKAAMIRFAKKIGFNGYSELRYELSRFLLATSFNNTDDLPTESETIPKITSHYCNVIEQLNECLPISLVQDMAKQILKSRKVKVFAVNRTALGAMQLQMRALKIGIDIDMIRDQVMMMDAVNLLKEDDYCIIFTIKDNGHHYAGKVEELVDHHCPVGLVTMAPNLPFAKLCKHVVTLPPVSKGYAKFIDEQAIYFVFVEILLTELALLAKENQNA